MGSERKKSAWFSILASWIHIHASFFETYLLKPLVQREWRRGGVGVWLVGWALLLWKIDDDDVVI